MKSKILKLGKMALLICLCFLLCNVDAKAATEISGDWSYEVTGSGVTITKYAGSSSVVNIPGSIAGYKVTKIASKIMENNTRVEKLTIPESIVEIGNYAFSGCTKLSEINFNAKKCSVGSYIFTNAGSAVMSLKVNIGPKVEIIPRGLCDSYYENDYVRVTELTISDSVKEIGEYAFDWCEDLHTIKWGSNIEKIYKSAFRHCIALEDVVLPNKLIELSASAFEDSYNLRSITIPAKVTYIGNYAFSGCTRLEKVNYNARKASVGSYIFTNAGSSSDNLKVVIGSGVEVIPKGLCDSYYENDYVRVTELIISDSVKEIGEYAFDWCEDLHTIKWGSNIEKIYKCAFHHCIALKDVVLPNKLIELSASVFEDSYNLRSVTIPSKVTYIGNYAFSGCTQLSKINYNARKASVGSYIFTNAGSSSEMLNLVVGSGVEVIPRGLCDSYYEDDYVRVTSVTIPNSVTEIGEYAFDYCIDLKKISLGTGVKNILGNAFSNCYELKSVVLPASVEYLGNYSFKNNKNLESFTIKARDTGFGYQVFSDHSDVLKIKCYRGSTVAKYAAENNVPFVYMDLPKVNVKSIENITKGIKLSWSKVSGAKGYEILRKTEGGSYKSIKKIPNAGTLSWTDTSVKDNNGKVYYYRVKAYSATKESSLFTNKKIARVKAVALSSVKNSASKKIAVKWKKNSKASGYQIYYATKSNFNNKKSTSVSGASKLSKTISGLSKGKTYYVKVRAYKTVNGTKYYSAWSSVKKVKVTK